MKEVREGWEHPNPVLPDPFIRDGGFRACNEPLTYDGVTVGYCSALVLPRNRRRQPANTHKGPHRVEWTTDREQS